MATAASDVTAAARIRDAALQQFAARGVGATSIRDVAKRAGVSPGLVQHHYGSKAGLRRAVEEHVIRRAVESFGQPIGGDTPSESSVRVGRRISAFVRTNPAMFAYIGRSLLEDDAAAQKLFERLLAVASAEFDRLAAAGLLRANLDRTWAMLHVILIDVAAYLLEPALSRHLGESLLSEHGLRRMEKATEAIFLKGIYRGERPRSKKQRRR
jgi:AcrR family transcriptional regulator